MANWRTNALWGFFTLVWAAVSLVLIVLGIFLFVPFLGPRRAFFAVAPWWARQMFAICGISSEVRGWENLPEDIRRGKQPVIFMSNHESQLDPCLLIGAIPVPAVYLAKKEVKYIPFVGWACVCAGVIWIDRGNHDKAIASLREATKKIRGGRNVVMFVEGTRTPTGELLPFKKGGFNLAMDAGVPIVPLAAVGGFQTLPRGARGIRPGRYVVSFGEPVDPGVFPERDALMAEVRSRIEALIAEARNDEKLVL